MAQRTFLRAAALSCSLLSVSVRVEAQALTWSLAGGSENWSQSERDCVTNSMNEAVDLYNRYGHFEKHVTANFNAGVPTAQANYDGWIDFGGSCNTRVAMHEIAHTLGTGTYWAFDGGAWDTGWAAGKLVKLFDGQGAVLNTGGTHFWPYGLNFDNEDGPAARERQCKLVSAFRFDMGIVKDSDADGLPDDWEMFHFDSLDEGAADDGDADGITNLDEYASDADPTQTSPVADGKTYVIRSQLSGRALTLATATAMEGSEVVLRDVDRAAAQQWTVHYVGDGFHRIEPVDAELVLEVPGTDTASGLPLRLAKWTSALHQQWRVVGGPGAEPDHFQISNRETGRVVDGLDGADGASVQQYPFLGNIPQQFWVFEEVVSATDAGTSTEADDAAVGGSGVGVGMNTTSDGGVPGSSANPGASTSDQDAGLDAYANDPATKSPGGCSVGGKSGGTGTVWMISALALVLVVRRRRRERERSSSASASRCGFGQDEVNATRHRDAGSIAQREPMRQLY